MLVHGNSIQGNADQHRHLPFLPYHSFPYHSCGGSERCTFLLAPAFILLSAKEASLFREENRPEPAAALEHSPVQPPLNLVGR